MLIAGSSAAGCRLPQAALDLAIVPAAFGAAVAVASPGRVPETFYDESAPYLVAFLCVLSVIWLTASGSYLSLTAGWKRLRYEWAQCLPRYQHLAAESLTLLAVALVQTSVFAAVLFGIRRWVVGMPIFSGTWVQGSFSLTQRIGEADYLQPDPSLGWVFVVLLCVGAAGSQLGLLLSAASRGNVRVAAMLLPLAMILQILLSSFVIRASRSDQAYQGVYAGFNRQTCVGVEGCPATTTLRQYGLGFLCEPCGDRLSRLIPGAGDGLTRDMAGQWRRGDLDAFDLEDRLELPPPVPGLLVLGSHAALTRPADEAMRTLTGAAATPADRQRYGYDGVLIRSIGKLLMMTAIFHALTATILGSVAPRFWRGVRSKIVAIFVIAWVGLPTATPGAGRVFDWSSPKCPGSPEAEIRVGDRSAARRQAAT